MILFRTISFLVCVLCLGSKPLLAVTPKYTLTIAVNNAYQSILDLRFEEAKIQLAAIKKDDPQNLLPYYFENYIDFLTCFISEEKSSYDILLANRDKRLNKLSQGDPASPYRLFTQSQVRLQCAIAALKFGDYVYSFQEVSRAYSTLKFNKDKHPGFMPNQMSLGAIHAAVGNIPDNYKWGVKMLSGMDGNVKQGLQEVEEVVKYGQKNPSFAFQREAIIMYAYLVLLLQNDSQKAWTIVNDPVVKPNTSPMAAFAKGIVAFRTGHNEEVITTIQQAPKGNNYFRIAYLDYMLGLAKLQRLDKDANVPIERFLNTFKGRFSIKEAWLRLTWFHIVYPNETQYNFAAQQVLNKGTKVNGGDKSAWNEIKSGRKPNVYLLKARLLFDGGYYDRAEEVLKGKTTADFADAYAKLEFTYRLGRIRQMRKQTDSAITQYKSVLTLDAEKKTYFACNSALQLGILYEQSGNKTLAKQYFNQCLSIHPPEYAESLHALAKTGLYRVK